MSADELNALIASEPKLHGNAYATIEDNTAHLQLSMPIGKARWLNGRYLNAQCSIESAPSGKPEDARITSIIVNGRPVSVTDEDEIVSRRRDECAGRDFGSTAFAENARSNYRLSENLAQELPAEGALAIVDCDQRIACKEHRTEPFFELLFGLALRHDAGLVTRCDYAGDID